MKTMEVWIFVFFLGSLALCWPLMAVFGGHLPAYLFVVWLLLIAAIAFVAHKASKEEDGG